MIFAGVTAAALTVMSVAMVTDIVWGIYLSRQEQPIRFCTHMGKC